MKTIGNINRFLLAKLNLCIADVDTVGELYDEVEEIISYTQEIPELFFVRIELLKLLVIDPNKFYHIHSVNYKMKVVDTIAHGLEIMESCPN